MAEIRAYRINKNRNISFRLTEREYSELISLFPDFQSNKSEFFRRLLKEKAREQKQAFYENQQN